VVKFDIIGILLYFHIRTNYLAMMKSKYFLAAVVGLLFLSSCSPSLTPFTQRMYDEFAWSDAELKKIQFYLSDDIRLTRDVGSEDSQIQGGKIRVKDGRRVEEIKFKKGTPGVLIYTPKENRFAISFDSDDRYLVFGPSKQYGGKYTLRAKDWKRQYGKITYGEKVYFTDNESAFTTLMVDIKKANKVKYKRENVDGRKVRG